jgi:hypothetical protein
LNAWSPILAVFSAETWSPILAVFSAETWSPILAVEADCSITTVRAVFSRLALRPTKTDRAGDGISLGSAWTNLTLRADVTLESGLALLTAWPLWAELALWTVRSFRTGQPLLTA